MSAEAVLGISAHCSSWSRQFQSILYYLPSRLDAMKLLLMLFARLMRCLLFAPRVSTRKLPKANLFGLGFALNDSAFGNPWSALE